MNHFDTRTFETARLLCRPFQPGDDKDMLENWCGDPLVQTEYGEPVYPTLADAKCLLDKYLAGYRSPEQYRWAIIEKASGKNIGQIAFCKVWSDCRTAEIEYCIGRAFWGRGYAGEALEALIPFAFQYTDFEKLEAYHRAENRRSGRVLEKSSMHITDNVQRFLRQNELPHGDVCYCMEKREFLSKNG